MPVVSVYDIEKNKVAEVSLSDAVFGAEVNQDVIYEVVRMQMAAKRQGTHDTKERSEIRGGGKKPWRQKGTGRARAGTIRSPLWRGGGTVFGPTPRDHSLHGAQEGAQARPHLGAQHEAEGGEAPGDQGLPPGRGEDEEVQGGPRPLRAQEDPRRDRPREASSSRSPPGTSPM